MKSTVHMGWRWGLEKGCGIQLDLTWLRYENSSIRAKDTNRMLILLIQPVYLSERVTGILCQCRYLVFQQ